MPQEILRLIGFWPISLFDTAKTMLLVAILFTGPLFEYGIVENGWKDWIRGRGVYEVLSSWMGYRNYIVVRLLPSRINAIQTHRLQGPVSEELIWRSLIIPLHVVSHFSEKQIIFLTPLYFGIAHVHHLYEFRLTHAHTPLLMALARTVFQFTYTSLFGFFAAFVYIRTGNLLSVILAHSFCNWMGLPRLSGRVGVEAGIPIGPPGAGKRDDDDDDYPQYESRGVAWTVAYYILLVTGAVGFYWQLFPLTESNHALPVVLTE
jgi:prenyl protein peptidase